MAFARSFLYHKNTPLGRIFETEAEYLSAIGTGWKEAPWLVNEEAPFEKFENRIARFSDTVLKPATTSLEEPFSEAEPANAPKKTRKPWTKRSEPLKPKQKPRTEQKDGPEIVYVD